MKKAPSSFISVILIMLIMLGVVFYNSKTTAIPVYIAYNDFKKSTDNKFINSSMALIEKFADELEDNMIFPIVISGNDDSLSLVNEEMRNGIITEKIKNKIKERKSYVFKDRGVSAVATGFYSKGRFICLILINEDSYITNNKVISAEVMAHEISHCLQTSPRISVELKQLKENISHNVLLELERQSKKSVFAYNALREYDPKYVHKSFDEGYASMQGGVMLYGKEHDKTKASLERNLSNIQKERETNKYGVAIYKSYMLHPFVELFNSNPISNYNNNFVKDYVDNYFNNIDKQIKYAEILIEHEKWEENNNNKAKEENFL